MGFGEGIRIVSVRVLSYISCYSFKAGQALRGFVW